MRDYIILNNKNSNEIKGLLIQNLPPITKPRIRAEIEEIDGRDGDIVTPLGYGAYDKAFSIGLYGDFDINEVIKYFDSEGIVVFSNEPNKYYNYKILEQIDFEKLIRFRTADVMMHVQPFKYSTTEGKETEEMETKTASGSEIDLPDTNNEKLQMEKLKGDTHQDTIDAEEGNENEDTNLAINDVDPSKENYITLKGNTTQDQHESPNLLQITAPATQEFFGITITNNGDGTITLNGTATNPLELYLPNLDMTTHYIGIKKDTNYFLNGCMAGGSLNTYNFIIEGATWYADTGNGVQFNSHSDDAVHAYLSIASGVTFNNAIFKPMLIEGTEAIPFEPYGMTTPSPQYPSEVKVVTGDNTIVVEGKNLINQAELLSSLTYNSTTGYYEGTPSSQFKQEIRLNFKENTSYTFRCEAYQDASSGDALQFYVYYKDGTDAHINLANTTTSTIFKITSTASKTIDYLELKYIRARNIHIKDMCLVEGTDNTYTPYVSQTYPINLGTLELCKIRDYKDYLFKRNGKWFKHRKINKVVLSELNYVFENSTTTPVNKSVVRLNNMGIKTIYFSNIFDSDKQNDSTEPNRMVTNVSNTWFISLADSLTGIISSDSNSTKITKIKDYLQSKNAIVNYVLATPTEEEITDTSLIAQLDALHTAQLQETSYINSTPYKEYPYINLKYNVITPAPSPDRASEINKVTGNNVVSVQGKNEFNSFIATKISWQAGTISTENDGTLVISGNNTSNGYFQLGKKLSELCPNLKVGDIVYLHLETTGTRNNIYLLGGNYVWSRNTSITITQTMLNNVIAIYGGYGRTDTIKIMITKDVLATDYIPFSKTDYPISLGTLELCKIGDYQDYLYKNNGKWYVHKEIGKAVLDGSENWTITGVTYALNNFINAIYNSSIATNIIAVSNFFKWGNGTITTFVYGSFWFNNGGTNLRFQKDETPNLTSFKTWLSTHNTIVYYVLATPTEEEITDETLLAQLEALDNIYNQKGTTKIKTNPEVNNMPLSLDVSYTESKPITITNSGNIYSKPIFTIYGEGNIGVYLNDIQLFSINLGSEEQITIDVAEMQAYNKETKALKNRLVTGNYDKFLLKIGENKISFSGIVKKFEIENYSRWI